MLNKKYVNLYIIFSTQYGTMHKEKNLKVISKINSCYMWVMDYAFIFFFKFCIFKILF